MEINLNKLRDIAVSAAAERAVLEGAQIANTARKAEMEKQQIKREAKALIESIPTHLEKAAMCPISTESGRLVQALIPIVKEQLTSCMATKGYLSDREKKFLSTVKNMLKSLSIQGAEVFIHRETVEGSYSNYDGDQAEGPCKHYYICAQVNLDS